MSNLRKTCLIVAGIAMLLAGCNTPRPTAEAPGVETTPSGSATPEADASSTAAPEPSANSSLISERGIGEATIGTTFGELKQALGADAEFTVESPFIVDFDAIAVRRGGQVQYYILYLAGQKFGDNDVIQGVLTSNPNYRTAEKVGAGTTIAEAEQQYGNATLSYNAQNESREYVRFERQPAPNISFATGNANQQTAGVYASPSGDYNETQEFKENAKIESVLVICLAEACSG